MVPKMFEQNYSKLALKFAHLVIGSMFSVCKIVKPQ